MSSVFTRIIHGEIPCYKIAEDDRFFAFLDISPLAKGHTLLVPKTEIDYLFDLDGETLSAMTLFAQRIATGIALAVPCLRVGVAVIGLEVPHAHIHLIPLNSMHDMDFSRPKLKLPAEEMETIAAAIRSHLN